MTASGLDPAYLIKVVCAHRHRPDMRGERLLAVLTWQVDHDVEAAWRAKSSLSSEHLEIFIANERFRYHETRTKRTGERVRLANPEVVIPKAQQDEAGALTQWRFDCKCGMDRPVRVDRLNRWVEARVAEDPTRHTFRFEVTD